MVNSLWIVMTPEQITISWAFLLAIYMPLYMWARTRLYETKKYSGYAFFLHMLFILMIAWAFFVAFITYSLITPISLLSIISMGIGGVLHHTSLLLKKEFGKRHIYNMVHGPISHTLFFVFFAINSYIGGTYLLSLLSTPYRIILILCLATTMVASIIGVSTKLRSWVFLNILDFEDD